MDDAIFKVPTPLMLEKSVTAMFVRGVANNRIDAYYKAKDAFGEIHILHKASAPENEFAFITEPMAVEEIDKKLAALADEGIKVTSKIRIGDL